MNYTDFLTDRPVTYRDMQLEQLRQQYAGMAMQAIISNSKYYDECISISDEPNSGFTDSSEVVASEAVHFAGRRGGAEDDRYLWPQFKRVIAEVRPAWVVGENVAGITTMVEPGEVTLLGSEASLYSEDDAVYRYRYDQPFTVERVCSDLEQLGYTVQPVLIPACAECSIFAS